MAEKKPPADSADLLQEDRSFPPNAAFRAKANINDPGIYERAEKDPEAFWASFASELEGFTPWSKVLEWKPPHAKWFIGGTINASVNCVDRHVRGPRRNKAALIWEGEPGDRRTLTYFDLYRQVSQFANVLKSLGVGRGDRVAIYMPLIPELAIAMLACARIGAGPRGPGRGRAWWPGPVAGRRGVALPEGGGGLGGQSEAGGRRVVRRSEGGHRRGS